MRPEGRKVSGGRRSVGLIENPLLLGGNSKTDKLEKVCGGMRRRVWPGEGWI
jgi:hypothetical protein